MTDIKDKNGEPIRRGDHVFTPIRGGKHEGTVDRIVTNEEDAVEEGVKHPPKVRKKLLPGIAKFRFRQYDVAGVADRMAAGPVHGPARQGGGA